MEKSKEDRMDEKLKEYKEKSEIQDKKVAEFFDFIKETHNFVPIEIFEDDPEKKNAFLSDNIDYINSVYKGHSLSLTTDNYSIKASIYPAGCDFSITNNKGSEIAGWNDMSYHYTSMDCLAEFEMPEKNREELRTAIKELEPEINKAIKFSVDKRKELGLDKFDHESRGERRLSEASQETLALSRAGMNCVLN